MTPEKIGRWTLGLIAGAGIHGALGVVGSAVAAHRVGGAQLATAAQFLLFHASLVVGLAALAQRSESPRGWLVIASAVLLGVGLFSGDVALFALAGRHLFPMAAPTGGMVLIASWTALAVLSLVRLHRRQRL